MKRGLRHLRSILSFLFHRSKLLFRLVLFLGFFLGVVLVLSLIYYSSYCSYRFHQGLAEAERRQLWNTSVGIHEQLTPILMPVCDRPRYLERVLQGLAKVDGINEVRLHVSWCDIDELD